MVYLRADKRHTPLATDTEVNNYFSILKNIEIIEHKKDRFLLT